VSRLQSRAAVVAVLVVKLTIATAKLVSAALTGSAALLASGVHSLVDAADQLIFFRAQRRSGAAQGRQPGVPGVEDRHDVYYRAIVSSTALLGAGAGACLLVGLAPPVRVGAHAAWGWSAVVLAVAAIVEGASWLVGVRHLVRAARGAPLRHFLRESREPALTAVVAQDTAAVLGLLLTALGVVGRSALGLPLLDSIAAVGVGVLVAGEALVLARERRALAGGESAGREAIQRLRSAIAQDPSVAAVSGVWTLQLGPDELLVSCQIEFRRDLLGAPAEEAIDRVEMAARAAEPRASRVLVAVEPSRPRHATGTRTEHASGAGSGLV
jgi:divalent metal cation (Fe/Co/Zn/Cd) transporter